MNYENKFTEEILYQIKKAIFLSGVERENLIIHMDCNMYNLLISYSDAIVYKNNCFDENCHIVREDMLDLMPKNGVYAGSALERHIDCSSYELEHYLRAAHGAGEILDALKQKFSNIKFFTCSALGSNDRLGEPVRSTKEVLFGPRRLRMELPIIWLMYQRGLIRR